MGLKKQIIQFKDGEQVAVYNSATEAANAVGSTKSNISKCCYGNLKQVNGFTFKYSGEFTNKIDRNSSGDYKCPYCEDRFETYNSLCKHVMRNKKHGEISKEQLLTDSKYNGIRPTCKCGCGGYTDISYEGGAHFRDYICGHQSRVHNNWGHNEIAKKNSSETRRRQFANGEREIWNKGKTWEEIYDVETLEHMNNVVHSLERAKKISEKLTGVPKSEEHVRKIIERMKNGDFSIDSENEKIFIENFIKPLGIEYIKQYYIKEIKQFADILIPSKKIIIEYDGDFWHCNPKKYPEGPIYESQIKKVNKDRIKNEWAEKNGYEMLRFWESDVLSNVEFVVNTLHKKIFGE